MTTLLASLLIHAMWAAVVVHVVRTADRWWRDFWQRRERVDATGDVPEIPNDLMALAMSHREPWAQEDTLRVISERYGDLKDWNRVRVAMNIGEIDG